MPPDNVVKITVPGANEPPGASWSNCLRIGNEIAVSGITARGADGAPEGGDNMGEQTRAVFARLARMLEAAGGGLYNVYKLVIYVTDMSRKDEVNAERKAAFAALYPCSTLVEVNAFAFPGLLVEVDAFANLTIDMRAAATASA
ncbi:MAG: RidA family protein [Hyphomicrobiales bacterium]|nr:RidA family protein [Hyphomicrobiales bacterium]